MRTCRVLTIAGSDSGGGAGIQADLKTITVLGGFGMSVITALTAQNTLGVQGIYPIPPAFIAQQFDAVAEDIGIDAAKTGMLATPEVLRVVADRCRHYDVRKLVVDPVMVAKGGAPLLQPDAQETMIGLLLPLALVVTPNIPEAEVLTGIRIVCLEDMRRAAVMVARLGPRYVLIKGGHLLGILSRAVDVLYDGRAFREFESPWIETRDTHGTGCTYSAAITTGLALGEDVPQAVAHAKAYVTDAIRYAWRLGGGHGPTNHLAPRIPPAEL